MKFYDIEISLNKENEVILTQNNIYEGSDCVILTKDMIIPVIHELENLNKVINEGK